MAEIDYEKEFGYAEGDDAIEHGTPGESDIARPEPPSDYEQEFGFAGDEKYDPMADPKNPYRQFGYAEEEIPEAEPAPMEEDPTWQDYGRMIMSGGAHVGAGVGWLLEKLGPEGSAIEAGGKALKERGQESADTWMRERLDVIGLEKGSKFTLTKAMPWNAETWRRSQVLERFPLNTRINLVQKRGQWICGDVVHRKKAQPRRAQVRWIDIS